MLSLGFGSHVFKEFLVMREITSSRIFRSSGKRNVQKQFRNGAQKRVPESAGLVGADLISFTLVYIPDH